MIRKHENSDSWKAGALAIGVHAVLLAAMLISFNWKAAHPTATVTEVELWDKLPAPKIADMLKLEPKPVVEEKPKLEEPKVNIALEKKKKELAQKEADKQKMLVEKRKKDEAYKKLTEQMREEDLHNKNVDEKSKKDAVKKLKQDVLSDVKATDDKQVSTANVSIIGEYTEKIKAKIRNNVNKTLCGDGNPELRFEISVLPTGQLGSTPKITKSSGSDACDEAVGRAIIASEPLPLPEDASLKSQFKNLKLKFRPND